MARAIDAGLRNVVGSFGASLSRTQALKLKEFADHSGVTRVIILFDRDEAGQIGAIKAQAILNEIGLGRPDFRLERTIGANSGWNRQDPGDDHRSRGTQQ